MIFRVAKRGACATPSSLVKQMLLCLLALCLLLPAAAGATGTFQAEAAVVQISTAEDLAAFLTSLTQRDYAGQTVQLTANIAYPQSAVSGAETLPFQGNFDGQGHTISNYTNNFRGLFATLGPAGTVQKVHLNMNIENIDVPLYGAIANISYGTVSLCWVTGIMEGGTGQTPVEIGGIVGNLVDDEQNPRAQIDNCLMAARILPAQQNPAQVTGYGIAGTTDRQNISASLVTGEVDGDTVYGISGRGASRVGLLPSFYDNTLTSPSFEDQYSVGKTYQELCAVATYADAGWDTTLWYLLPGELPQLSVFGLYEEETEQVETSGGSGSTTPRQTVAVRSVTLDQSAVSIVAGEGFPLYYTISPRNATNQRVTWTSDNPSVATVSTSGWVSAISQGQANIRVITNSGGYSAVCQVTVMPNVSGGINLDAHNVIMNISATQTLKATLTESTDTGVSISWNSSAPEVATITPSADDPLVATITGLSEGDAQITVSISGTSLFDVCNVTVTSATIPVAGVSLNVTTLSLGEGQNAALTASITPSTASNPRLSWSSSNPGVATVNESGVVTGISAGEATITVTTEDGGFTASCTVAVSAGSGGTPTTGGGQTTATPGTTTATTTTGATPTTSAPATTAPSPQTTTGTVVTTQP